MEEDILYPGSMLYSEDSALKSLLPNGSIIEIIPQGDNPCDNSVGTLPETRFCILTGFLQIEGALILAVDSGNNCIKLIDRLRNQSSVFSGDCESIEKPYHHFPGHGNHYYQPLSIIRNQWDAETALITSALGKSIQSLYVANVNSAGLKRNPKEVANFLNTVKPTRATFYGNQMLVSCKYLVKILKKDNDGKLLEKELLREWLNDFSDHEYIFDLQQVHEWSYVMAEFNNDKESSCSIKVLDFYNNQTYPLINSSCTNVRSLLWRNKHLYYAGDGYIRRVAGELLMNL